MRARTKQRTPNSRPRAQGRAVAVRGADAARRGGVQSLARAFSLLEEIARNRDGIGLADLSKRVALHNSTAFHLVRTLVSLGYVRQMKETKRYRVGRPLFALAASALDEVEMVSLATPVLEDFRARPARARIFPCAWATRWSCWRAPAAPAHSS